MANITNRGQFIDYCLRALGEPVIKVNIDSDQLEDRIDEALDYFRDYHYDGVEKVYLKQQLTQQDIDNEYIVLNELVQGVTKVYPFANNFMSSNGLFSTQYQLRMWDLFDLSSTSIINYEMAMNHVAMLDLVLNGHKIYQFNRVQHKLYINQKWDEVFEEGDYILVECYRALDPAVYASIWNQPFLKHYAVALIKRQWATNGKKYSGVQLPGGTSIDFQGMYDEAITEIEKLEQEMIEKSAPLEFFLG